MNQGSDRMLTRAGPTSLPDVAALAPQVQLLENGALPRTQLRYTAPVGFRTGIRLGGTHTNRMSFDGVQAFQTQGPSEVDIDAEVVELRPDGSMRIALRIAKLKFIAFIPGMAPIDESDLRDEIVLSSRGTVLSQEAAYLEERPELIGLVDARDLSLSLPEEAVGIGARWQASWLNFAAGFVREHRATYELVSIKGAKIVVNTTIEIESASSVGDAFGGPGSVLEVIPSSFGATSVTTASLEAPLSSTSRWTMEGGTKMFVRTPSGNQSVEMVGRSTFTKTTTTLPRSRGSSKGSPNGE